MNGRQLNVRTAASRAYLARLWRAQRVAAAQLQRAIPSARITHRYRVILDAFAVQLPARRLPTLARLSSITRIYPSLRYKLKLNKSPSVIGADTFWATTGKRGEGVKIGVVDDGVDQTNPFFAPTGYSYPPGFPKGNTAFTTPKVIVAKSFPGPGSGQRGKLPVDRQVSFHGTHVAGIAAGNSGTTATPGPDHPLVSGLSGVAPHAWIGNYRVFNAPTPTGYDAFTPEIVEAFEQAVIDGMNVINFSGGGPMPDPVNDAFVEALHNVSAAGVVPVMAAGNDRDDFGLGTVGSPGTAPDAISVAAVSNTHVFAPIVAVQAADAPASLTQIPFQHIGDVPGDLTASDQTIVDVGTIRGTDGNPVERHLCGPSSDPNGAGSTLPAGSLRGDIVLVFRGYCSFISKLQRAKDAGALAAVMVDNRPGEANPIPILPSDLPIDAGMIADLDGANLRDYLDAHGGHATIRYSADVKMVETGRSGMVTSFSSAGPTAFTHQLKPDVSAPGGQILSSTLPEFAGAPFAVFDGTSMATPHVTGAAALLVQDHPNWTAEQVKSALMSTAGTAYGNTKRTTEASVLLEGAGLINVARADKPKVFLDPQSLSFGDLDVNHSAKRSPLLVTIDDAGGGAGTWSVSLAPQSATAGAQIDMPSSVTLAPGGSTTLPVTARATAGAVAGDDGGFVVLKQGSETRRIPYYFAVTRPAIEREPAIPLKRLQTGDTSVGTSNANVYRFPTAPFGPPPSYFGQAVDEKGAEQVYVTHLNQPAANIGAAVIAQSQNSLIDPWWLGSPDENDVQGYPGTPINANVLTFEYQFDVEAAGALFPRQKAYYVSVDSNRDPFTGLPLAGRYLLRSWVNDVTPPRYRLLTRRVTAGRPLLAAIVTDRGAGVDPLSLVINYRRVLLGAALYDPFSGLALFPIPRNAPSIPRGKLPTVSMASDYQESKNIDQAGENILPNTKFTRATIRGVAAPTAAWLLPAGGCFVRGDLLAIAANAPRGIRFVRFYDGRRPIATVRRGQFGLWVTAKSPRLKAKRRHLLRAVAFARGGRRATARHAVHACR
jgi:subtilisin family serine protease